MPKKQKPKNSFQCFICLDPNIDRDQYKLVEHQSLNVTACDNCVEQHCLGGSWHSSREWKERDDRGKCIYCEICGEGGTLLPCDVCPRSYCTTKCLKPWLGEQFFNEILEDESIEFKCFVCTSADEISLKYPIYQKYLTKSEQQRKVKYKPKKQSKYSDDSDLDLDNLPSPPRGKKRKEDSWSDSDDDLPLKKSKTPKKLNGPSSKFTCYACFEKFDMFPDKLPKFHPSRALQPGQKLQKIILCEECYDYVDSDDWTYTPDEKGFLKSDYCVVSGDGGEIYTCDDCPNSYCARIMEKYLGKSTFKKICDDDTAPFLCWTCNEDLGNYKKYMQESKDAVDFFNHSSSKSSLKSGKKSGTKKTVNGKNLNEFDTKSKIKNSLTDTSLSGKKSINRKPDLTAKIEPEPVKITKEFFNSSESEEDEPVKKNDPELKARVQMKEILNISASEHSNTDTFKAVMKILEVEEKEN